MGLIRLGFGLRGLKGKVSGLGLQGLRICGCIVRFLGITCLAVYMILWFTHFLPSRSPQRLEAFSPVYPCSCSSSSCSSPRSSLFTNHTHNSSTSRTTSSDNDDNSTKRATNHRTQAQQQQRRHPGISNASTRNPMPFP